MISVPFWYGAFVFPRSTPDMLARRAYAKPGIQSLPLGVKCANIVPLLPRESNISSQGKIPPRRYAQSANFAFGEGRLLPVYVWVCIRTPISKEKTDHKGNVIKLRKEPSSEMSLALFLQKKLNKF